MRKSMRKKVLAFSMILCLVIPFFNGLKVHALEEIEIDKKEISIGQTSTISVQVPKYNEEIYKATLTLRAVVPVSGIASHSREERILNEYTYDSEKGTLNFKFTMKETDPSMTWRISEVNVIYMDLEKYSKTLENYETLSTKGSETKVDSQWPTFEEISLNKDKVTKNESITITLRASDDLSGVEGAEIYISGISYYQRFYLSSTSVKGVFSVTIPITEGLANGTYKIKTCYIYDKSGRYISKNFNNEYSFEVYGCVEPGDVTPPNVIGITNSAGTIGCDLGEGVKISIDAKDDISGIGNIKCILINKENIKVELNDFTYVPSTGKYEKEFIPNDKSMLGMWYLNYYYITDNAGNYTEFGTLGNYSKYYECNFEVTDRNSVRVNGATLSRGNVTPGQKAELKVDITDPCNLATKATVKYFIRDGEYEYTYPEEDLVYNTATKTYNGSFVGNDKTPRGELGYTITIYSGEKYKSTRYSRQATTSGTAVKVYDMIQRVVDADIKDKTFYVGQSYYNSIKLNTASPYEELIIKFVNYQTSNEFTNWYTYNSTTGRYQGRVDLNKYYPSGDYKVKEVSLRKDSFNYEDVTFLDEDFGTIKVVNDKESTGEIVVPEVKTLSLNKQNLSLGDKLEIKVTTNKDLGRYYNGSYVDIGIDNNESAITKKLKLKKVDNNVYLATLDITPEMVNGSWSLKEVYIMDDNRICNILKEDKLKSMGGTFKISGCESIDNTIPVFKSLSISSKNLKVGDTLKLSLNAIDNESGVKEAYAIYDTPTGIREIKFNYNSTSKLFECSLNIKDDMANGEWRLISINLFNGVNNPWVKECASIKNLPNYNFNVTNNKNLIDNNRVNVTNVYFDRDKIIEHKPFNVYVDVNGGGEDLECTMYFGEDDDYDVKYYEKISVPYNTEKGRYEVFWKGWSHMSWDRTIYNKVKFIEFKDKNTGYIYRDSNVNNAGIKIYNDLEDINFDGVCDMRDLALLGNSYNMRENSYGFKYDYDLYGDGVIDIYDIIRVASVIGE